MHVHVHVHACRRTPCLVAHNGYMFDFKIVKAEARRSGVQLPAGWVYIDTRFMATVGGVIDWR